MNAWIRKFTKRALVPALWALAFFMWGTWCARGYVQRHEAEIYRRGANDMKLAIFGAIERIADRDTTPEKAK